MRLWLVERETDNRDLVTLTYASVDGEHIYQRQTPLDALARNPATAGIDRDPAKLERVEDQDRRRRYADEAERIAGTHDPGDKI